MAKKAKRVWVVKIDNTNAYVTKDAMCSPAIDDAKRYQTRRAAQDHIDAYSFTGKETPVRAEVYTEMRPVECLREVTKA